MIDLMGPSAGPGRSGPGRTFAEGRDRPVVPETASGRNAGARPGADPAPACANPDEVRRLFYRWGDLLSSTLVRIRQRFDGDLDQYLLSQVFLQAELSQSVSRAEAESRGLQDAAWPQRGMNALSLADITRIPRESARRKLQILAAGGYLARGDDGLYYLGLRYSLDAYLADLGPLFRDAARAPRD